MSNPIRGLLKTFDFVLDLGRGKQFEQLAEAGLCQVDPSGLVIPSLLNLCEQCLRYSRGSVAKSIVSREL